LSPVNKLLMVLMILLSVASVCSGARAAPPVGVTDMEPARFGTFGDGKSHPIGSAYGGSLMSLAAHVGVGGLRPFAWVTDAVYGLAFVRAISTDQVHPGLELRFASTAGLIGSGGEIIEPGMTASAACLPRGDAVRSVAPTVVVLEHPSTAACILGTAITFTVSAEQVQALEADWLGLQAAIAAAHELPTGGAVHIAHGTYVVNRPLVNPGATVDQYSLGHQVDEYGDGVGQTRIVFARDLGPGACGLGEADRGIGSNTRARIRDLRLIGPGVAGAVEPAMDGFCIGAKELIRRVRADGFHAGVNVLEDHWEIQDSEFAGNFYGIYLAPGGDTFGNGVLRDVFPVGNRMASIAIASSNVLDFATLQNVHLGFGPYGFYREARPAAGGRMLDGFITDSLLENVWGESIGDGYVFGENGSNDRVQHNVWINSAPVMDTAAAYRLHDRVPEALVRVGAWIDNEMIASDFGNPSNYNAVSRAIIEASDNIQGNAFGRAPDMVRLSSAAKPALVAPVVLFNRFTTGQAEGRFMVANKPVSAGEILSEAGYDHAEPAAVGRVLAGVAMSPAAAGEVLAVGDRGLVRTGKVREALHAGDPLGLARDDPTRAAAAPAGGPAFAAVWQDATVADRDVLAFLGMLAR
jgi:hypothetical protein